MWSSWWTACVDGLATDWDALVESKGPCSAPMDARFCKGGLVLARFLLDVGAQRVDQDVRSDANFQSNWKHLAPDAARDRPRRTPGPSTKRTSPRGTIDAATGPPWPSARATTI